ncbi:hypothetical protein BC826DRAFT_1107768 [Russula brevipes]|nr:hypothetical protein BC826DRAFT_1107768 [Russula brevipes]
MTLAPHGLFRLRTHLSSLSWPLTLKAFSSSITVDREGTPAMRALEDIPYPSASPDRSIFESRSSEYDRVHLPKAVMERLFREDVAASQGKIKPYVPSKLLEQLLQSGKFAEAEQVRQELVNMKVRIRPNGVYCHGALDVLQKRPWPSNGTEMFTNWLSLLPDITDSATNLSKLKLALFSTSNHLDLETISQYGVILCSKGYLRAVGAQMVSCLTRFAHPDLSSRILDEMIAADDDHSRNKLGMKDEAVIRSKDSTMYMWSVVVRTHCTAGRPQVALEMARRAHDRGSRLTLFSYQYLMGKLEAEGMNEFLAEVRGLSGCSSLMNAKSRLVMEPNLKPIPLVSPYETEDVNRARVLTTLKRNSESGIPLFATDITPYSDLYKTNLRSPRATNMLRSSASRLSSNALSAVLLGEMIHHHRRGQFKHVLWMFDRFYHPIGVPADDIMQRLWKKAGYPPSYMQSNPAFLSDWAENTTFTPKSKLWPSPYHTSLVWAALVHLCEDEGVLFALYAQLLRLAAQFQELLKRRYRRRGPFPANPYNVVLSLSDRFDAGHFNPFLIAFTLLRDANAEILSTASALQARHGDSALAMRMLDVAQSLFDTTEGATMLEVWEGPVRAKWRFGGTEKGRSYRNKVLLSAYTGALRGLLDRRAVKQARNVAEQLRERLGYTEGIGIGDASVDGGEDADTGRNLRTDAALRYLRRLETEGPDAEPEPLPEEDELRHFPLSALSISIHFPRPPAAAAEGITYSASMPILTEGCLPVTQLIRILNDAPYI